jgi:hypothetical protein
MAKKATKSKTKRAPGGQTKFTQAAADRICELLADGWSLRQACRGPGMPSERTVRDCARDEKHPFAPQYARAREVGYHMMADELLEIADDARNDWMNRETANGTIRVVDPEVVQRSRLRVDTRKWLLSKALPKIYGDKIEATHTLDAGQAFLQVFKAISDGQGAKLIEAHPAR